MTFIERGTGVKKPFLLIAGTNLGVPVMLDYDV